MVKKVAVKEKNPWEMLIDVKDPKQMAEALASFVNNYGCQEKEFAKVLSNQHRTLQQSIVRLFVTYLAELKRQGDQGYFDLRNEDAVRFAQQVFEKIETGMRFV